MVGSNRIRAVTIRNKLRFAPEISDGRPRIFLNMSAFEDLEYYLRHEFLHAGGAVGPGATARTVSVNLKGTFNGLREAAKRLRNGGRIKRFHLIEVCSAGDDATIRLWKVVTRKLISKIGTHTSRFVSTQGIGRSGDTH